MTRRPKVVEFRYLMGRSLSPVFRFESVSPSRAGVKFELAGRSVIDACAIFKMNERRNLAAAYAFYCGKDLEGADGAGQTRWRPWRSC